VLLEQSNGFRDGFRAEVLEGLGDHFFASSSKQPTPGVPENGHANAGPRQPAKEFVFFGGKAWRDKWSSDCHDLYK
jgi:hypothetical protein